MTLHPKHWGFTLDADGGLLVGGARAETLADAFGTPLHLIDEAGLERRATELRQAFVDAYPGRVRPCFALKSNNTPGVVRRVLDAGFLPEVGTPYEWWLSRELGYAAHDIVANGPNKGGLLEQAVLEGAGLIVVDGAQELQRIGALCDAHGAVARVLLRVNPNTVPKGMNRASATGSRRHSVFGFDLVSGEVPRALAVFGSYRGLRFEGFHCHVGTGIRRPEDYVRPLRRLAALAEEAGQVGLAVRTLDVGGGFGVPTSREFDTMEFLLYQGAGRLPAAPRPERFPRIEAFAAVIGTTVREEFTRRGLPLPDLVVEPGRSVVSSAGVLLVRVGAVKRRAGVGTWVLTDGAAGTVAFPLFYEYHEVLVCRDPTGRPDASYAIVGPVCFSADWVYRNKRLPEVRTGDVLAICDAGAYFTVQESSFGFPRPAVIGVRDGHATVLRRREAFADMVARDDGWRRDDAA